MLKRILGNVALALFAVFVFVVMMPFWLIYFWLKPEAALDGRSNAPTMSDVNDPAQKAKRLAV
jgi:hypothetical protein